MIGQKQIFEYLEFIAPMIPTPLYWLNLDCRFLGVNDKGVAAIGAPNKEYVIGKTPRELYKNDEIASALEKTFEYVISTGKRIEAEDRVVDVSTGSVKYFITNRSPLFNSKGQVIAVIGTSVEITDRKAILELEDKVHGVMGVQQPLKFGITNVEKQNEKNGISRPINTKLINNYKNQFINRDLFSINPSQIIEQIEHIAEKIPCAIYLVDLDYKVVGANKRLLDGIGAKLTVDILGKTVYDFYPKYVADNLSRDFEQAVSFGYDLETEHEIVDLTTRQPRYFEATVSPLRDGFGKIIGVIGTSLEITSKKEAERLKLESQELQIKQQKRFREISAQVAHDIGSPLAALQMVIPHCDSLPENTRNVLNKSAIRIADIAENFLSQFKPKDEQSNIAILRVPTLISAELLEVLTEKKYEYSKLSVNFSSIISQSGAFAFINIDSRAFKRTISNLINNAVDAFEGELGEVIVHLNEVNKQVHIIVEDNGKGMPDFVKNKILDNIEVTSGKTGGHGIGFSQIRETLASNDGKLNIESEIGIGTRIILTFPKINSPAWIVETIQLYENDVVVILDDDDSIHGAWETIFDKSAPNIIRQHFKQGNETVTFINSLSEQEKQKIFLLTDYELLRQNLNGLEVIEKTGIKRSILVTSHHNNKEVREQAKQTNTKILPKPLASVVQINIIHNDKQLGNENISSTQEVNLIDLDNNKVTADKFINKKPKIFYDLEALVPLMPSPLYWLDTNIILRGANDSCLEGCGRNGSVKDEFIGKRFDEFHPKEVAEVLIKNTQLVIDSKKAIKVEEWIKDHQTGRIRYFETIRSPLFDEDGITIVGVFCNAVEITKQKEEEQLKLESQQQQLEQQEKFRKLSAQVAHDISSPLAALQMVIPHCDSLPENTRNVLNKSAIRIADIAENFLSQFKPKDEEKDIITIRTPTLISAEILEILTEKKYEYSKLSIDLSSNISQAGAFAFINVDQRAFKRMISNLINNGVDAFDDNIGEITVHLAEVNNQVQIIVEDNGSGMSESVKEKILNNIAVTSGKEDGHGIGFTQIRDTLASNDGKLSIESKLSIGTKIILTFPKVKTPEWMAETIELNPNDLVVILDDDESIHGAWETRFEKDAPSVRREHLKLGTEAIEFINNLSPTEKQQVFLLTDYELLRQNLNGLDVIEKTGIKRSILVTSHHNNKEVRAHAKQTGTKILPKPLASEIAISTTSNKPLQEQTIESMRKVDLVILDDDKNLIDAILMFAVDEDTVVDKYYVTKELLDNLTKYPKETRFLIDNQYKNEAITGIAIAKQLHELGYTNLNLFSGEYFDENSGIPDYLNVVSKNDPNAVKKLLS